MQKYVDDTSVIEPIDYSTIPRHITTAAEIREVNPRGSQQALEQLQDIATTKNIVLNADKTTLLAINPSDEFVLDPFLSNPVDGSRIKASEELKLVGFNFSNKPNVWKQVRYSANKARKRIFAIRNLRNAGMPANDLVAVYKSTIRSVLEYAAPVMSPMMNDSMHKKFKKVEKMSLRAIFGFQHDYDDLLDIAAVTTVRSRLESATVKFAESLPGSKFAHWIPEVPPRLHDLRNPRRYQEFRANTERLRNSPLFTYRRILNERNPEPLPPVLDAVI